MQVVPSPVAVNVQAADVPAPLVTVNVEPTPIEINVPEQPVTLTLDGTTSVVSRDRQGRIMQIKSEPNAQVNKD